MTKNEVKTTLKGKLLKWLFISVTVFGLWLFIYAQKNSQTQESEYETVNRLTVFYQASGYVDWYDYDDDVKRLQWIKQWQLDELNYAETVKYVQTQKVDNEFVTMIDEAVKKAKELKLQEPLPDYLKIDTKQVITKSKQELNFINLLK